MANERKLTPADLPPSGGLLAPPPDMVAVLLSKGFYTCGSGCPDPRACLADEHCERGFIGNATGFTSGYELPPRDAKLEAEQYAKRDAEFRAWYDGLDLLQKESRTAALEIAFNAGWAARKKTEFGMAFGLDTSKTP